MVIIVHDLCFVSKKQKFNLLDLFALKTKHGNLHTHCTLGTVTLRMTSLSYQKIIIGR